MTRNTMVTLPDARFDAEKNKSGVCDSVNPLPGSTLAAGFNITA